MFYTDDPDLERPELRPQGVERSELDLGTRSSKCYFSI